MPAIVTTPVAVTADSLYTPTAANQPPIAAVGVRTITTPVVAKVNVSGVIHYVTRLPIRRWNGTAWVTEYVPRF